jgi:uncharacterized membrane protein YkoI
MTGRVAFVFASMVSMAGTAALAADKKLSRSELPQKVAEALDHRFPGADLTSAEKETEEGNVVYDLELKQKGRKYEMDVKEDGTILEVEKEIKAKDVPAAVTKAVRDKFPHATVKEVMEKDKVEGKEEKPTGYEVTIEADGKPKEVVVSLDGKSVKEEAAEEQPKK